MTRVFLFHAMAMYGMALGSSHAGVSDGRSTRGRRLQHDLSSIHIDVMHPKLMSGWKVHLARHMKALLNRDANSIFEVKIGADKWQCPQPARAVRAMSEEAYRRWSLCEVPMDIAPVEIRVSNNILGELQQVLDTLSDDDAFGENSLMFLSIPRSSPAHELGPSYAEFKDQSKVQFDGHFVLIIVISIPVLLVVVWLFIKLVTHFSGDEISARSPLRRAAIPVTFAASLLTGTIAAPVAVGVFWRFRKNDSNEQGEALAREETDDTGSDSGDAAFE